MTETEILPSESDINVDDCLDGRGAAEHFFGKTITQAEAMFRENDLYYANDLVWMGPVAFRFYVPVALRHAQSPDACGNSDLIQSLATTCAARLRCDAPAELAQVASVLLSFCNYVIAHFDRFYADPDIYGDLCGHYSALAASFQRILAQEQST